MYVPRSGAFRKVNYAIEILQEEKVPKTEFEEVLKVAQAMTVDAKRLEQKEKSGHTENEQKQLQKNGRAGAAKRSGGLQENKSASVMQTECLQKTGESIFPEGQNDALYPANVPFKKFPVTSPADIQYTKLHDFDVDELPDYDLDSEDEEWLENQKELHITPNRFEYIFARLNVRNTHVKEKAIGALPPSYHQDFHHVFPYWKEKRRCNRNLSNFKPKLGATKDDVKLFGTDPFLVFVDSHKKSSPLYRHEKNSFLYDKDPIPCLSMIFEWRKQLRNLRDWAAKEIQNGENKRNGIVNSMVQLGERYTALKVDLDTDIDQNNNGISHPHPNAYDTESLSAKCRSPAVKRPLSSRHSLDIIPHKRAYCSSTLPSDSSEKGSRSPSPHVTFETSSLPDQRYLNVLSMDVVR